MDSTNSGSIQSSSSGDDYYDPQTDAISSSLNLPPPPPQPSSSHHLHHHPSPSSISPWPDHVNTFPASTPPVPNPLGLDMTWAGSLPPSSPLEHGCTINLDGLTTTTSSSSKTMALGRSPPSGSISLNPSVQLPTQLLPSRPTGGSKKRSRASRRTPTTILATDTSNFRAMVQEFTGFPGSPFISSPSSRPRLDLFHSSATTAPTYRPLGPLAPKLQSPTSSPSFYMAHRAPYFSRISVANASTSPASTCSNTISSCSATSYSYNYGQLPSGFIQHPNLLNMESPDFTFQSSLSLQTRTLPYHNSSTMPAAFEANQSLGPSNLAARGPAAGHGSLIAMEPVDSWVGLMAHRQRTGGIDPSSGQSSESTTICSSLVTTQRRDPRAE